MTGIKIIDLRSDAYTMPTKEMLETMKTEPRGVDAYGETLNRLEELAAEKMGKEAALFTNRGTQGNMVSILSYTKRGDAVILDDISHTLHWDGDIVSMLGGVLLRTVVVKNGYMDPNDVEAMIRQTQARTSLICIENTHNRAGGIAVTPDQTKAVWDIAKNHDIPVFTDGARIFNAAIYLDVDVKALTKYTDSVMFCLQKGLCAPFGSLVCGTEEFVEKARVYRHLLVADIQFSKVGIMAAAGIIALTKMVDRLKDDHETAAMLAEGLQKLGAKINHPVQTNILYVDVSGIGLTAPQLKERMARFGIITSAIPRYAKGRLCPSVLRLVTHRDIDKEDIRYILECVEKIAKK